MLEIHALLRYHTHLRRLTSFHLPISTTQILSIQPLFILETDYIEQEEVARSSQATLQVIRLKQLFCFFMSGLVLSIIECANYWNVILHQTTFVGNGNTVNHDKNTDLGQFIPYADSSYIGEPYFDYGDYNDGKGYDRSKETFQSSSGVVRSTIRNVTAQLGTTTYLHCRVNNLGGKTVWENFILCFIIARMVKYIVDQRLNVSLKFHEKKSI